ncbi:hypothetical protein A6J80_17480 [Paracoccus yeei]|uniref:Uncharacterized protein n=2 Tax=Paracoccus yeei TaxID=147645 RepID=A0A1V0GVI5_9RHOB|nr:hypothetical protein A6J80_17480 [Paracoccus yeei]
MLQAAGDPSALQAIIDSLNGKADIANSGKVFPSRESALTAGQEVLRPALSQIITREDDTLAVRSASATADDPLFESYPQWGVVFRAASRALLDDKASLAALSSLSQIVGGKADISDLNRIGKVYASRDDAIAQINNNPPAQYVARVITIESDAIVVRARGSADVDPLFSSGDPWGVFMRLDRSDLLDRQNHVGHQPISSVTGLETALYRNTRVYTSRSDAVTAITNEPPPAAVVRVITIEDDALVVRGRKHPSPDPLFNGEDTWGEMLRFDVSDLRRPARLATFYFNRADAVSNLPAVPADVYRVLCIEGGVLTVRARELATDDPLFSTAPRWGVQRRIDIASLSAAIAAEAEARQSAFQDEVSARNAAIAEASDLLRAADSELSLRIDALSVSASLGLYVASSVQDGLDNTEDGDVFLLIDAGSAAFTRNLSGQAVELYRFVSGRAIDLRPLPFATRVDAEGASIPAEVGQIVVDGLDYRRDPEGMALQTQDGARWSPWGTPTTAHFATVQAAIDWVGGRGGDLLVPPGTTSSPALNLTKLGAGGRRVLLRARPEKG